MNKMRAISLTQENFGLQTKENCVSEIEIKK